MIEPKRFRRRTAVLRAILFLLLFSPAQGLAQEANPLSLTVGDKVRLREPGRPDVVTGTVSDVTPETFSFFVEGEPGMVILPYAILDTIVVRRNLPRRSALSTGIWGLFLGATVGAIAAPFAGPEVSLDTGPAMAAFSVGGGVTGAAIGGAIGAFFFPERWYRHILH